MPVPQHHTDRDDRDGSDRHPTDPGSSRPARGRAPSRAGAALAVVALSGAGVLALPPTAFGAGPAGTLSTSFEDGQPQPSRSTVEKGPNGLRQSNVTGSAATDGSLLPLVTAVTADHENGPSEIASNLADANPDTKWLAFERSATIDYTLSRPAKAVRYSLTSANDAPERDPNAVTVQGSTDGTTWVDLDTRTGIDFPARFSTRTFDIATPGEYSRYRLVVTANHAGGLTQLADFDLSDGTTGTGGQTPMVTTVGSGPISGFNIKPLTGFTGTKALRYSGGHTAAGRGYAWNTLYDTKVEVGPDTVLSYRIIPDFISGDLTYPSTYAALDLRFTDGTYLSDLEAVDGNGVDGSPQGQGAGKILYAGQWNDVTLEVGAVAAGKTVERVLIGYDNPNAKADTRFGGWVDDLRLEPAERLDRSDLVAMVDTRRGTNSSGSFSRGNNLPISALPNGFTFLTPQTDATSDSWQYYWQAGNNAANKPMLQGLGVSHEPSPWMGDRNQLSVMPSTAAGAPTGNPQKRALEFDHAKETARPDLYEVELAGGIKAAMTPADHGGVWRFTFPRSATTGHLVLDSVDDGFKLTVDQATGTVTGWVDNGSGLSAGRSRMFVHGTFSAPVTGTGKAADSHAPTTYASFDTSSRKTVELKLATSFISAEQARRNHTLDLGRSFDQVRKDARASWQKRLGVVEVKGARDSELRTLYGSLYRLNLYPNSQFENTGTAARPRYRYASPVAPKTGEATDTTTNAKIVDGKVYVNNGLWDTYRTVWPAYSLLYPEVAAEIADGFVQQYRDGGWVARWSSPGYADLMTGTSSDVAFADAYVKGVPLPDPDGTYQAALKNATVLPTSNAVGRKGIDTSQYLGFTPRSTHESISWGLEGYINDYGIATMAAGLAKDDKLPAARRQQLQEESEYLFKRSTQYANAFNPQTGFFQGKDADGTFTTGFDPEEWGGDFTETNGWNFAFHAPHDGAGLAALHGGRDGLATKLDQFFATPEKADKPGSYGGTIHEMIEARDVRMGQLGQSNQPSHHIPYMYDWTGQQWKTAEKVREIMRRLYVGGEIGQGYPGDEDNGEMSSWYVLSALGIYPLQVGSPAWAVGSPKFAEATVHRSEGDLVVSAKNNSERNIYVQSMSVNGKDSRSVSVPDAALSGSARLDFTMGAKKSSFGSRNQDLPQSVSRAAGPQPLADATGEVSATDVAPGSDPEALADNTSRTSVTFTGATPVVSWTFAQPTKAAWYTVTNGASGADPSAWRLEGSNDGSHWTTLDTRAGQTFPWRTQLRPFKVAKRGNYSKYRLVVTATSDGKAPTISELELLTETQPITGTPAPAGMRAADGPDDESVTPVAPPSAAARAAEPTDGATPGR